MCSLNKYLTHINMYLQKIDFCDINVNYATSELFNENLSDQWHYLWREEVRNNWTIKKVDICSFWGQKYMQPKYVTVCWFKGSWQVKWLTFNLNNYKIVHLFSILFLLQHILHLFLHIFHLFLNLNSKIIEARQFDQWL